MAHRTRSTTARGPPPDPPPPRAAAEQPVSQRTRSRYALAASQLTALPVLDVKSGKLLEHKQLRPHLRLKKTWDTHYANELGRLCQEVGESTTGPDKQHVAGTSTFRVVDYNNILKNKRSGICHTRVVCEYCADKDDPNRTCITLAGGHICVPYNVFTPVDSLELINPMTTSVLFRKDMLFTVFDVNMFTQITRERT